MLRREFRLVTSCERVLIAASDVTAGFDGERYGVPDGTIGH